MFEWVLSKSKLSRSFSEILCFILVSWCFEISVKNQLRHQGYNFGVLISFGNFGKILDLVETHSNISWGSETTPAEVSGKAFEWFYPKRDPNYHYGRKELEGGNWPCSSLCNSFYPVVTWMSSDLLWWNSVAVMNPMGTSWDASPCIVSAFASLILFKVISAFFGA